MLPSRILAMTDCACYSAARGCARADDHLADHTLFASLYPMCMVIRMPGIVLIHANKPWMEAAREPDA